jgi:hypothetical protein
MDREQLLDDIARCFAHAAIDAWLLEQDAETATPATSCEGTAGVIPATRSRARTHDKPTRPHPITAS